MTVLPEPEALVIWSDADLLVVNKPAGLPTLPDGYQPEAPCLVALMRTRFDPLWVVHRLDKETSGVMLFARSAQAHRLLNTQFEQRQALKSYHALVAGAPDWTQTTIELALRSDGDRRHRSVLDARRGKPAITELRLLERFASHALLEATPRTGRTHQIRAHLAAIGLPIAGDSLYTRKAHADEMHPAIIERTALHAWRIALAHPTQNQALQFEAPYPADFALALQKLRLPGAP